MLSTLVCISFIGRRNKFFPRIRLRDARVHLGGSWELFSSFFQDSVIFCQILVLKACGSGFKGLVGALLRGKFGECQLPQLFFHGFVSSAHWVSDFLYVKSDF